VTAGTLAVDRDVVRAGTGLVNTREAHMAGMLRKLIASGVAAKVIAEARKPQNQAKIKKAIADFQNKRGSGGSRPGGTTRY
jgi:hypothetical protein